VSDEINPGRSETDRKTGAMLKRFALHIGMCAQCRTALMTRGQVKPCGIGHQVSVDWLEMRASEGDRSAAMYLQGIRRAQGMGD
jgi:hypothetical protein